jgi:hypothetical protein
MALKNVDIEAVLRRMAEKRIEEAIEQGKFDNLPGAGKPQDLEPLPADEDARALWWALRIMRNADFQTDELRYRKRIARLRELLELAMNEAGVIALVREHNELVRRLNTMGTNAIRSTLGTLDETEQLERLSNRTAGGDAGRLR